MSIQFSFSPWEYDEEAVDICKKLLKMREDHAPYMLEQSEKAIRDRVPLIRPLWWYSDDPTALNSSDQFFVGDDLLVAPVVVEGAVKKQVYLPDGRWQNANGNEEHQGPVEIEVDAPLNTLPYFIRVKDSAPSSSTSLAITSLPIALASLSLLSFIS
jgi:alpha-glucosidase